MRLLNMIMGGILTILGVFSIANAGLSFISMAFPIGVILTCIGIVECISYRSRDEDVEHRHWVLIDGLTTFILGIVVLTGQLAADVAVPVIFGMWSMIAGIRYLVIITHVDKKEEKNLDFYWTVIASICNFVVGLYTFFNVSLFNLPVLMMLGIIFIVQGINVVKVGIDTTYRKPNVIKTKEDLIAEAERKAEEARLQARIAVKKARRAKRAIKEAEEVKVTYDIFNEPIVPPEELLKKAMEGKEEKKPEEPAAKKKRKSTSTSKSKDASTSKNKDASASKNKDASASKNKDASASKSKDASASKNKDTGASKSTGTKKRTGTGSSASKRDGDSKSTDAGDGKSAGAGKKTGTRKSTSKSDSKSTEKEQ